MKNLNILILALLTGFFGMTNDLKAQDEDGFTFGGAMRYNIISTSYNETATNPAFTWDTWRLNVDGSVSGVDLSFEYRFYPTFGTHFIHHGFLGYAFNDNVYMELGVTQVPFGIETYASHSWWFQGQYYVGLEDDYDMGINFDITGDNSKLSLAYFRQQEPEGPKFGGDVTFGNSGPGRYSYDVVPGQGAYVDANGDLNMVSANLRELNQFNARYAYNVSDDWELGVSAQVGGIYNAVLDESETGTAFAGHVLGNFGSFNLKAQYMNYNYNAKSDNGEDLDIIQMGAYGYEYFGSGLNPGDDGFYSGGVAKEASIYAVGLAYSVPVEFGPISNLQFYVDYTLIDKAEESFYDTEHLVPGMLVTAGSIYTYVDYAMGKNQPWLTGSFGKGLGTGVEDPEWNKRFNINIGYYF
ncbi:MAG: hypothetical protein U5L09_05960 [Bacteroidales bacterium]|nr:hypothetical protein [Bacteroidales bacterium]